VAVITVFRQAGCGGRYIAENLAHALGYHFSDYLTAERILLDYGLVRFEEVCESVPDFWEHFTQRGQERDEINFMMRSLVLAEAKHGNVVMLGRGFFAPLQGLADVLNVRLMAPLPFRINRVMHDLQMTNDEAAQFVKEKDVLVADFAKTVYGVSPDDVNLFDLAIDTSKVHPESALRWLIEAGGALGGKGGGEGTTAAIQVDRVLARAVSEMYSRADDERSPLPPVPWFPSGS